MSRAEPVLEARRVAVVAYHSSPLQEPGQGDAGGMTVFVREVAKQLAAAGVATDIFTRATGPFDRARTVGAGVRVISVEAGPRVPLEKSEIGAYLDDFIAGVRAYALGARAVYDLVHSHYWQSGLAGVRLARSWGVPLVHSHHTLGLVKNDLLAPGDEPEPQSRIDGEHKVISEADVLIASTDSEWEQLSCLYRARHDTLKTIHPGVDHDVFFPGDRDAARRELGLGDGAVMLYVGRIQPLKGLGLAVLALEEILAATGRDVSLLVVGGPSGRRGEEEIERLEALVEQRGLGAHVRFAGPQPHTRLPLFYRAADLLAVCSHSESFGLSALEAQACGTPVIATAAGGLSFVVEDGHSGILLPSRDPKAFAAAATPILFDEDARARYAQGAVARAQRFSWSMTARTFKDLYDCLLRERTPEFCTC